MLEGPAQAIAASAQRLAYREHVHGLDLLAYRFEGDVPALMTEVCAAVEKPVIMAGSINSPDRIAVAARAGAAGFTVGTAALAGAFPAEGASFAAQVRAILDLTARASAHSTAPVRVALAAYDTRKAHLRAWVLRHAKSLARHRLICTGSKGRMITDAVPVLSG